MTRDELKHDRERRLALAAGLNAEVTRNRREFPGDEVSVMPGGPMPSTDRTDTGVQEIELGLIANQPYLFAEVIAATDRLDCVEFGTCETCGRGIAKARLDALPYARTCTRCTRTPKPVAG